MGSAFAGSNPVHDVIIFVLFLRHFMYNLFVGSKLQIKCRPEISHDVRVVKELPCYIPDFSQESSFVRQWALPSQVRILFMTNYF